MRIRNRITTAIVTTALASSAFALTSGAASAATVTCKTTITHHHSVSAKGTVSDTSTWKHSCGSKNYQERETGTTLSYTGAVSSFTLTKIDVNGCWTETEVRHSVSKKGTASTTVTHSGNC